ncbi:MAG: hypothetical protein O3A96_14430 [Proteobacteria bacterium]|nr:hypothetical protein [Pseudomonadota bacterium]
MIILGLNAYHADAAACLVRDGELIAAAEEERFRRIKHWAGFPSEAIRYCLEEAGIGLESVDHVAINRDPKANFWPKVRYTLAKRPSPALVLSRLRNRARWGSVAEELAAAFPDGKFAGTVHEIEHHLAHLASAFLVSPFEEAAVVSVDGFGDFSSAAWGIGRGSDITVEGRVLFPHSLGIFYQALTQHLGFPHYGDEYKVMGLAPYGAPTMMEAMRRIVRLENDGGFRLDLKYFRHHAENVAYEWVGGEPKVGRLYAPALDELLGPARRPAEPLEPRHHDLARSIQAMFEEV